MNAGSSSSFQRARAAWRWNHTARLLFCPARGHHGAHAVRGLVFPPHGCTRGQRGCRRSTPSFRFGGLAQGGELGRGQLRKLSRTAHARSSGGVDLSRRRGLVALGHHGHRVLRPQTQRECPRLPLQLPKHVDQRR